MQYAAMNLERTILQDRLSRLMEARGEKAAPLAERAGLSNSFVRDILRGKTKSPRAEGLDKIAKALDTTAAYLMGEVDETDLGGAHLSGAVPVPPSVPLPYAGIVQAGDFRSVGEHFDQDDGDYMVPTGVIRHPNYPDVRQAAWQVRGDSMDEAGIRDGMWVVGAIYMDYLDRVGELFNGQYVVVERTRHGGSERELTVKEVQFARGGMRLVPRSSNKGHKEFFVPLDGDADPDTETVGILAVVLSSVSDYGQRTRP